MSGSSNAEIGEGRASFASDDSLASDDPIARVRLQITGVVQGVGFRPFVHRLACDLSLTGRIGNDDDGVWCELQGPLEALASFAARLVGEAPPLAHIDDVRTSPADVVVGERGVHIEPTHAGSGPVAPTIPPDVAPCAACLAELHDPADRRYGYPFTCCTDCGPRYTVVVELPYDRERTAMADFPLCDACAAEYAHPGGRRHHAQAICCPACGPRLADPADWISGNVIDDAAAALAAGSIVALKGVGGYQLVCRADDELIVQRLRARKHRDEKPFALLVASLERARALIDLDELGARALASPEAPILLAHRRPDAAVADAVAPGSALLGVMLPGSPLHQVLSEAVGAPLVCTSGNRTDEPIAVDDDDATTRLHEIADVVIAHDRRIARRADDSVVQVVDGDFQLLRRARGYAPRPIRLGATGPPVLGVGAMLKNTVCLALDRDAHVSVHLGDLEHPLTIEAFEHAIADLLSLTRATPELIVHDLHPEYVSTKFTLAQQIAPTLAVQHHHAHLASCLAEHRIDEPAIGVTFDGFGWGTDGSLWGGEFLVGGAGGFERAAHLVPVAVPGGGAAVRDPWRMAVAHLAHAYDGRPPTTALAERHGDDVDDVLALCTPDRSIMTSSIGRLFDAVAALLGVADTTSYEGQAAIRLEQSSTDGGEELPFAITGDAMLQIDPAPLIRSLVEASSPDASMLAGSFHRSLAAMITEVCGRLRDRTGLGVVALTGGVFQNVLLVELVAPLLRDEGFTVLRHVQVPPNDGGISLGQVAIGRAHLAAVT